MARSFTLLTATAAGVAVIDLTYKAWAGPVFIHERSALYAWGSASWSRLGGGNRAPPLAFGRRRRGGSGRRSGRQRLVPRALAGCAESDRRRRAGVQRGRRERGGRAGASAPGAHRFRRAKSRAALRACLGEPGDRAVGEPVQRSDRELDVLLFVSSSFVCESPRRLWTKSITVGMLPPDLGGVVERPAGRRREVPATSLMASSASSISCLSKRIGSISQIRSQSTSTLRLSANRAPASAPRPASRRACPLPGASGRAGIRPSRRRT